MRKLAILFIVICCSLSLCQAQSHDELLRQANDAFATGDYETAIELCESLMQVYEKMPALQLLSANAYRLNLQYNEARALYKSLAKTASEMYPEALFWLAEIEQLLGNKKEARYYYNRYLNTHDMKYAAQATNALLKLQFTSTNEKIEIVRDVNSPFFHNYGVSILNDSTVYNGVKTTKTASYITFAPLRGKYENLFSDSWFSYSDMQEFQNQMYVARRPAHTPLEEAELCVVRDSTGVLSLQPVENQTFANQGERTIHAHFTRYNSSKIVFFSSDRAGGFGGFDVWYCTVNEQGEFGEAINAGAAVNSLGDEICPFFDVENERLYFSSDWHTGMGGFDIFYTHCPNLQFESPQNLGAPVNSSFNDFYYRQLHNRAYFTSNRPQKKPEKTAYFYNSVFYFDLPKAEIPVTEPRNDVGEFRTTLFFRHDFPNEQSELTYKEEYTLYKIAIEEQLAQLASADFSVAQKMEEKQLRDFVSNQLTAHFAALQQEIQNLAQNNANNTITIELQARTSASGNYEYNQKLAERRTMSVRNYVFDELQKAGIAPDRIIFGEKLPIIPTETNKNTSTDFLLHNAHERIVEVRIMTYSTY